jgi:LacI family transcriptional regulator
VKPIKRSTLKDVALISGYSIKTVSRALAGQSGVNHKTLSDIQKAAKKLDYRPNRAAQQLRSGHSTHAMALLIGELHNPFYSEVASGIESVLRPEGFDIFIASSGEDAKTEKHLIENFIERDVEGILIIPTSNDHFYLESERNRGLPVVFLDRPPVNILADSVTIDNRKAAETAANKLIKLGHTKIVVLADAETVWTASERIAGFYNSAATSNLKVDPTLIFRKMTTLPAVTEVIKKIFINNKGDKPTAILALNNQVTIAVLQALKVLNLDVPLIGFDDFDLAQHLNVTVMSQNAFEMGRQGALLALSRREAPNKPPVHLVLKTELVDRGIK